MSLLQMIALSGCKRKTEKQCVKHAALGSNDAPADLDQIARS